MPKLKMSKIQYWTFWGGTDDEHLGHVCDVASSLAGAKRMAKKCEKLGGAPHRIFKVEEIKRG